MLNWMIRLSLTHRWLTIVAACIIAGLGLYDITQLPIDVLPDLNRPRVTVITEVPGLAAEEVESLVTFPIETALNGATGVIAVRSSSAADVSVVHAEFDWSVGPYIARQVVNEKLAVAASLLPENARPILTPMASVMGQIQQIGITAEPGTVSEIELRTLADWVLRPRILTLSGVAQVTVLGGGRKQFQVLVNPDELQRYDVTLHDVESAVAASNLNTTGGYLNIGGNELLVRAIGRIQVLADLQNIVVKAGGPRPVVLSQVARIVEVAQVKRGDASVNGQPGVLLFISRQPTADTRLVTDRILAAIEELRKTMPPGVKIYPDIYQQKSFIDLSTKNVEDALRDGSILVVIILFIFLLNFRTTLITLTAIPLSILMTAVVFRWFGMSINTMTLGGIAVAIGELVDDAIVDVENIFRRLKENRAQGTPVNPLRVVLDASLEVRSSIVFSTALVVLVFIPLFALDGLEGKLFTPLGLAYITSILASLVVSLTVTPVMCYWLLPNAPVIAKETDGLLLRVLKFIAGGAIHWSMQRPVIVLGSVSAMVVLSAVTVSLLGRDFLPPFNEGAFQVNLFLPPGTSLETSVRVARLVDTELLAIEGVRTVGRRTGRAELDEHAEGVNYSEVIVILDPASKRTRAEVLEDIRKIPQRVPGAILSAEQPLQHAISHMLSGVKSAIGLKIHGDDLTVLRGAATAIHAKMAEIPGVTDLYLEPQVEVPQLQVRVRRDRLAQYGLTAADVNHFVETAMNGRVLSEVLQGQRKFGLLVRLDDKYRNDPECLKRLSIGLPGGGRVPLTSVADIVNDSGPTIIQRENVRRRVIVQCNVLNRDLVSVVEDIRSSIADIERSLPPGYSVEFSGQYASRQAAANRLWLLGGLSLAGTFILLFALFRSVNLTLQVLSALPMAAIGAVAALWLTSQSLSIAAIVGFISLSGIASRNGILLIEHYLHLVTKEGETLTQAMIVRAGKERLAPMLMTALSSGISLLPLVWAADQPGREVLYPVATVILGGLVSSTLLDFFVHPALFWCFGRNAVEGLLAEKKTESDESILGIGEHAR